MIKIRFLIQSSSLKLLSLYAVYLSLIFKKLNIKYTIRCNPTKQKRITLLKSPHVYKKHKEQFSIKKYSVSFSASIYKLDKVQLSLFFQNKPKLIDLSFGLER